MELPWQENPANTYMGHTKHWAAVSTLLGFISSADRDHHQRRSDQQPQYADAETLPLGHRLMSHISEAELTIQGKKVIYIYIYIYNPRLEQNMSVALMFAHRNVSENMIQSNIRGTRVLPALCKLHLFLAL